MLLRIVWAAIGIVSAGRIAQLFPSSSSIISTDDETTDILSADLRSIFDYSMALNDARFNETCKYIVYENEGLWNIRFTSWCVTRFLWRNDGRDLENAKEAVTNM